MTPAPIGGAGRAPAPPDAASPRDATSAPSARPQRSTGGGAAIAAGSIGVVVVSFEAAAHLPRCLASVEPLARAGHPVVVIDNASRDASASLVRERFGWARLEALERNVGFAAACNRGAGLTASEHLLFLNPDAWLAAGCAERLAGALERQPQAGAVAPRLAYRDGRRQFVWEPTPGIVAEAVRRHLRNPLEAWALAHAPVRALYRALGDPGWLTAACLLVRRRAFESVGGFDEGFFLYFEDADLCRRMARAGWRLAVEPQALAWHAKGGSQRSGEAELHYRASQLRFYREHRGRLQNRLIVARQRRRARRVADPELRSRLLALCAPAGGGSGEGGS